MRGALLRGGFRVVLGACAARVNARGCKAITFGERRSAAAIGIFVFFWRGMRVLARYPFVALCGRCGARVGKRLKVYFRSKNHIIFALARWPGGIAAEDCHLRSSSDLAVTVRVADGLCSVITVVGSSALHFFEDAFAPRGFFTARGV